MYNRSPYNRVAYNGLAIFGSAFSQALSDTVLATDGMTYRTGLGLALSDNVLLADAQAKAIGAVLSDMLTLADLVQLIDNHVLSIADTVALADSIAFQQGRHLILADNVGLSEAILKAVGMARADVVALTESILTSKGYTRNFDDSVLTTDQIFDMALKDATAKWIGETAAASIFSGDTSILDNGWSSTKDSATGVVATASPTEQDWITADKTGAPKFVITQP